MLSVLIKPLWGKSSYNSGVRVLTVILKKEKLDDLEELSNSLNSNASFLEGIQNKLSGPQQTPATLLCMSPLTGKDWFPFLLLCTHDTYIHVFISVRCTHCSWILFPDPAGCTSVSLTPWIRIPRPPALLYSNLHRKWPCPLLTHAPFP